MKKILKQIKTSKGFVILFAVIISTIIMLISFGIFTVATKSTLLSANSREALAAFYAADGGVECALATVKKVFASPASTTIAVPCNTTGSSTVDATLFLATSSPTGFTITTAFTDSGTCASVEVVPTAIAAVPPATFGTTGVSVYSRGFNKCNAASPQVGNPKLLERTLEVSF